MLSEIEQAVKNRIGDKLAEAAGRIEIQRGIEGSPRQAVYVSVDEGSFNKVTSETYNVVVKIFVDILFSNMQSEEERRKGIAPILEGMSQCLLLQTLGLKIDPIIPLSFRNTTTQELKEKGLIAFTLEFRTKFSMHKISDEAVTDLLVVGLNYYLKPGDDVVDASDTVTLSP